MNLFLTTQREKVTGGMAETLEIQIADELGTRSYELYSGGEAFRINFALRVALSQVLARRAGAHLRTLFLDEGFGTQDEDGRNKLVEAITAIQDDFDLILVITHIDELRDSFPVHVVVEKTGSGSRVSVR
jgi:exonuclease SbcC